MKGRVPDYNRCNHRKGRRKGDYLHRMLPPADENIL